MGAEVYKSLSALIVDDQEFVLKIVTTILTQIGFGEIRTAENGEDAIKAVEKSCPDLVICDINMKPMDGLTYLQWVRGNDSEQIRKVPLVFLTADFSQEVVSKAADLGCDMFLLKPISPQKMREKLDTIFDPDSIPEEIVEEAID